MRTCCGCGRKRPQHELVPLHPDERGSLAVGRGAGRGAYVCPLEACVSAVRERPGLLRRSLRARVSVPDGLWQAIRSTAGTAPPP